MKITIVQGPFLPAPPLLGGAVEKIWYSLGKQFAKMGHEVTHISRSYKNLPEFESVDGVNYKRISGFNSPQNMVLRLLLDFIYASRVFSILPIADILVTNSFSLPILIRSWKYGRLYVHVQRYPKGQVYLYKHAARVQTVSNSIAQAIINQQASLVNKVNVIPNPLPYKIEDINIEKKWPKKKNQILYAGRIHPEKGIDILIKAFMKFQQNNNSEWILKIIGPWKEEAGGAGKLYLDYLKELSKSLGDKIYWNEPIYDQQELNAQYKESKLFVYPSIAEKGEALPLAPVEAMSHGCVPIVSKLDCFKDYIEDSVNGYTFDSLSDSCVINLYECFSNLIGNNDKLKTIALNSYSTSKKYSLDNISTQYINDFSVINSGE